MKYCSYSSIVRAIGYILIVTLFTNCKKDYHSPNATLQGGRSNSAATLANLSQTRTATLFNYNLEGQLVTNYTKTSKASDVASDDGVYASTTKLSPRNGYSLLVLQGFNFQIPANATIHNIRAKARRFKTGTCGIWEVNASLVIRREITDLPEWWDQYGARWADSNQFPLTETAVNYSQSGSGTTNNGTPYQWTPARINDSYFGILFQTGSIENSKGSAVIKYELVEISVEYALP
jgi:hypothetical protein